MSGKIKIVSDGTFHGTFVSNSETGEMIPNIVSVDIRIVPGDVVTASIEVVDVDLEVVAEKELEDIP